MYEITSSQLQQKDGLNKQSTPNTKWFLNRLPKLLQENAQFFAPHPHDYNLFAVGCDDSTIVMRNVQLEKDRYQVLGHKRPVDADDQEADDTRRPPAHVLFTPSGDTFVVIATSIIGNDARQLTTICTRTLPEHSRIPAKKTANDLGWPEICRKSYPETLEGSRQFKAAQKKRKAALAAKNEEARKAWVNEVEMNNRGNKLVADSPLNTMELPHGHPLVAMTRPKRVKHLSRESVILLWPECIQTWFVGAREALGKAEHEQSTLRGLRCNCAIEWPLGGYAEDSSGANATCESARGVDCLLWWLVGTDAGEVHLLHGDSLKLLPGPALPLRSGEGGTSTGPDAAPRKLRRSATGGFLLGGGLREDAPPVSIPVTALSVVEERDRQPGDLTDAALIVGFEDGSVRQYCLQDLLTSL